MVLGYKDKNVYATFAIIFATAPTFGAILSGYIGIYIGGYSSEKAMPVVSIILFISSFFGAPIPFYDSFEYVTINLGIYLFFGGILLPLLTGIMLSTVEPELRPQANSFANFMYNIIGYLPATFIYGIICEMTGGSKSRYGMI